MDRDWRKRGLKFRQRSLRAELLPQLWASSRHSHPNNEGAGSLKRARLSTPNLPPAACRLFAEWAKPEERPGERRRAGLSAESALGAGSVPPPPVSKPLAPCPAPASTHRPVLLRTLSAGSSLGPLLSPGQNLMAKSQHKMPEEPKAPSPALQPDSQKQWLKDPQEGANHLSTQSHLQSSHLRQHLPSRTHPERRRRAGATETESMHRSGRSANTGVHSLRTKQTSGRHPRKGNGTECFLPIRAVPKGNSARDLQVTIQQQQTETEPLLIAPAVHWGPVLEHSVTYPSKSPMSEVPSSSSLSSFQDEESEVQTADSFSGRC